MYDVPPRVTTLRLRTNVRLDFEADVILPAVIPLVDCIMIVRRRASAKLLCPSVPSIDIFHCATSPQANPTFPGYHQCPSTHPNLCPPPALAPAISDTSSANSDASLDNSDISPVGPVTPPTLTKLLGTYNASSKPQHMPWTHTTPTSSTIRPTIPGVDPVLQRAAGMVFIAAVGQMRGTLTLKWCQAAAPCLFCIQWGEQCDFEEPAPWHRLRAMTDPGAWWEVATNVGELLLVDLEVLAMVVAQLEVDMVGRITGMAPEEEGK
ncbi:hypothetical protein E4T56_gene16756 [Termitomyces sp. T112]|nr:hypothetical protein E4T56_gene16756 [Termitomyces sp. T112]